MTAPISAAAVAALADEPLDWRFKGLPAAWWGRTVAEIRERRPDLFGDGAVGPVCVLQAEAVAHNISTMARWCAAHGVQLAPHGKTHMAPQLLARQLEAGACAVTAATISQVRMFRAFGVRDVILANELVDEAGLRWLGDQLDADPAFNVTCWVDSVRGVELMTSALAAAGTVRPVDVCVEVGMPSGRTGCRDRDTADAVAHAVAASARLRLVGVAGYEAALGHGREASGAVASHLADVRAAVLRLAPLFETDVVIATAGGSTYFDAVAEALTGWPAGLQVSAILRSGCYLAHDDGLYGRTSPLRETLRPALSVWAQVMSRPQPDLALLTMGRRDVSFDQDLPVPRRLPDSSVTKLNDQHAYLRPGGGDSVDVGDWVEFGISHPCTVFDKWPMIPMLDEAGRVVDLIRTFF
ncbi:alanine racemase [Mycolicibacterium celeriflavum]|uniref:Amino acid deaminase n=1 Tax=Mycolicibacterium celeriflavum TaxID=1249101 RepID=A0A1X0BR80_MYCCF|nr:alanine racemase [Mycolicibacterium celeriflavum]MCV7238025.1 alanine racemase [Mycolicibacterium celeriflavum]ORA45802.1 amino acid deaminase [Mycolicibacterium celeriflavum]BBY45438.1 amino acid deaminase [Mycolicibacterium celeriflavum]